MKKLRILLADGHRIVRAGLRLLINTQPDMAVIGEAAEGKEAYAKARSLHPDVAVLELDLPRWNGLQAAEQIKLRGLAVAVLVLTAHEKAAGLAELLDAKASGCVLKRSDPAELFAAIRAVAKGAVHFDPALVDPATRRAIGTSQRDRPTPQTGAESPRPLTAPQVSAQAQRLWALPLAQRMKLVGLSAQKADVILPGAVIFEAVMEDFAFDELAVSANGLRYGALIASAEALGHRASLGCDGSQRPLLGPSLRPPQHYKAPNPTPHT